MINAMMKQQIVEAVHVTCVDACADNFKPDYRELQLLRVAAQLWIEQYAHRNKCNIDDEIPQAHDVDSIEDFERYVLSIA